MRSRKEMPLGVFLGKISEAGFSCSISVLLCIRPRANGATVAHLVYTEMVGGSNPSSPTMKAFLNDWRLGNDFWWKLDTLMHYPPLSVIVPGRIRSWICNRAFD